jgi:hypothetical protein
MRVALKLAESVIFGENFRLKDFNLSTVAVEQYKVEPSE